MTWSLRLGQALGRSALVVVDAAFFFVFDCGLTASPFIPLVRSAPFHCHSPQNLPMPQLSTFSKVVRFIIMLLK